MKKVTVRMPVINVDKWKMTFGGGSSLVRKDAATILEAIDRRLHARWNKEKMAIRALEYQDGFWQTSNESTSPRDSNYLLYCTACFLEDYLSSQTLRRIYKKTNNKSTPEDL